MGWRRGRQAVLGWGLSFPRAGECGVSPLSCCQPTEMLTFEMSRAGLVASVVAVTTPSSASPFLQDLATSYPSATLVGMLAPSTPFSTGRPRTLFWQGEVLEGGTVGVARIGEGPGKISMGWEGLVPVKESEVLIVDSYVASRCSQVLCRGTNGQRVSQMPGQPPSHVPERSNSQPQPNSTSPFSPVERPCPSARQRQGLLPWLPGRGRRCQAGCANSQWRS